MLDQSEYAGPQRAGTDVTYERTAKRLEVLMNGVQEYKERQKVKWKEGESTDSSAFRALYMHNGSRVTIDDITTVTGIEVGHGRIG